jgi:membrane protein implicated in regulation of membrane protease activity
VSIHSDDRENPLMEVVYLVSAGLGVTLLLLQLMSGVLGIGDDDGSDDTPDDSGTWLVSVLTLRSIGTALTFFGLIGMAGLRAGWDMPIHLLVALAAAGGSLYAVVALMRSFQRLGKASVVRLEEAVGQTGKVYLRIPANDAGCGKVTIVLNGQSMEVLARTKGEELPTGSTVVVYGVLDASTLEVALAPKEVPNHV